jgi:hypothetical protein
MIQGDGQKVEDPLALGAWPGRVGGVRSARFLAPWKDSAVKPAIYHCISRVVDRRFVFDDVERHHGQLGFS